MTILNTIINMNRRTITSVALALVPALIISFSSCKEKKTTTDPEPAKTLNKTTLLNKLWQNQGGSIKHEFKTNGTYRFDGSWKWVNNSDTMEIVMSAGEPALLWKIYWNTDHEMQCRWINNSQDILMKDQAW
jgi:hypothetical protein